MAMAPKYALRFLGAALLLAGVGYLFRFDPGREGMYPQCPFHFLARGLYCPGCGSLRCLHALLHGEVVQAFAYNALTVLSLPYLALASVDRLYFHLKGKRLTRHRLAPWMIWAYLGLVMAFWVLRNLPLYPFGLLAPHRI